ncbi:glutamate--cysteine ligase [Corynebacterium sp. Marseille-P4321]|uniref:glutamate--cysteine ligase n=1 Tax=Corynebacterium sp. Marseille-P4321 TaxID=2736603 RepID=UPI00158F019B|nr:glutamate--cysteine ligase [Corynebacterium sp. Marseille-P4321]
MASANSYKEFNRSAKPTLGVEWELGLLDTHSRDLVPHAAKIIDEMQKRYPDTHLEREFLQNTVELVTPVCKNAGEAVANLKDSLYKLKEVTDDAGLTLWSSGGHPFSDYREQPLTPKITYQEIFDRTQFWGQQMLLWGVHCHVGISHEDKVWPIINAVMTNYMHILAVSASSPGWNGLDTGYASNRTMMYQQLPTAGMPYHFDTWDEWVSFMSDQEKADVISQFGYMHFDVRPAAKWGTIEVRIADSPSNLRELAAIVAFTHCLIVHYDRMLEAGEELPDLQPWYNADNKWRGARFGLEGCVIVDREGDQRWIADEVRELVDKLMPVAADLECVEELKLIDEILDNGAGYQRQRNIYTRTGDWVKVVDATAAELWEMNP